MPATSSAARQVPGAPPPLLVEPTAPLARVFDPGALDPSALLEAIEQWIKGIDVKRQLAAVPYVDQLAQLVAMTRVRVLIPAINRYYVDRHHRVNRYDVSTFVAVRFWRESAFYKERSAYG
jgi:hypothetical protein